MCTCVCVHACVRVCVYIFNGHCTSTYLYMYIINGKCFGNKTITSIVSLCLDLLERLLEPTSLKYA